MNIGVEKIAYDFIPFFFHFFYGRDSAVGATDVEENLLLSRHHRENLPSPLPWSGLIDFAKEGNDPSL